ncbi:MAG: histidine phosphatase family protein [Pseudobdellovibrionaceae bacterium]
MTTRLIIARHGNTFSEGQTPTRVGARTDLPLVESGENQALKLGHHLLAARLVPHHIFTSTLKRTIDTARLASLAMGYEGTREPSPIFDEVDYGAQENLPEPDVIAQLGTDVLAQWDKKGVMPEGWLPRPATIITQWQEFLTRCVSDHANQTVLVVTSNGIARFALALIPHGEDYSLKLATGAYGILEYDGEWSIAGWNIRP